MFGEVVVACGVCDFFGVVVGDCYELWYQRWWLGHVGERFVCV